MELVEGYISADQGSGRREGKCRCGGAAFPFWMLQVWGYGSLANQHTLTRGRFVSRLLVFMRSLQKNFFQKAGRVFIIISPPKVVWVHLRGQPQRRDGEAQEGVARWEGVEKVEKCWLPPIGF